jgi:S1-C subfamily serine protease
VRRAAAAIAAALLITAAGCDTGSGGGDQSGDSAAPRNVTTTRVQVVQGLGGENGGKFDPGAIYDRLSPGVVTILSIFDGGGSLLDEGGEGGQGSGFVVDGDGYIATNAHVVTSQRRSGTARADNVYVEFFDGNRVSAKIVGDDPNADVALLKVDPAGLSLTPLRLGRSASIGVGEPVAAIGSPFGERQSLSVGVISALDRTIESLTRFQIGDAIQTDAAINPGNSGGPLLDADGRVIGINAQIRSQSGGGEGVGFAVPVDTVRRSLRALRDHGRVDYGYLGVETLTIWPQLAERLGLGASTGALVQDVVGGSPAERAGLKEGGDTITFQGQSDIATGGDLIVGVNGRQLTREHDLADDISAHRAGDRVRLTLIRDGKRRTVDLELGKRPGGSSS